MISSGAVPWNVSRSCASTAQAWGDERTLRWQTETYRWLRRRRGGAYVPVSSDIELADLLFDVLRRRRVVE